MQDRIYLDNAATSWPKPASVYEAVDHYQREIGAPAGRGTYREAVDVERRIEATRTSVATLFNVPSPSRVIFTSGGTEALNYALHGLLRSGDHVITSKAEHNSVLRPLRFLENLHQIEVSRVPVDGSGRVDPMEIRARFRPATRLVVLSHASNVTGAIQPVAEVGAMVREYGILYLVDAAQTAGHLPVDIQAMTADLIATSGHKGLFGPLGTGILCMQDAVEEVLTPLKQGGTGSRSSTDQQPDSLPDAYESGNLNVPGIMGLSAGVDYVLARGVDDIRRHESALANQFLSAIAELDRVTLCGASDIDRVAVISVKVQDLDPQEVAGALDAACRVQVRSGFHCAALIHESLGSTKAGTVRFSWSALNTPAHVDAAVDALKQLAVRL